MNLETANNTLRQLMGNGLIYTVPRFQRDYSWDQAEWEDLWRDIELLYEEDGEDEHYMGYLVLQSKDNKNFDLIDGQQRLTTLSIIVLATLVNLQKLIDQNINPQDNEQRKEQLRNGFIGYLDPVTLIPKSKLNLNRNNDQLYQHYLISLRNPPKRNLKASEHLIRKAYEWYIEAIGERFAQDKDGQSLARFIDSLSDKLFFTVIMVNNELNAYKVFETLNARGVKLSSTDLLKNYLFSVVHNEGQDERELKEIETLWEKLVGLLGNADLPDFLRAFWNSRNKFVRHSELFKRIRSQVTTRQDVFKLMRQMEEDAHIYAALPNSEDPLWDDDQRKFIKELRMFNVRQLYPLLMAGYRFLDKNDFKKLLKYCSVISFRYNVIGNMAANFQERVYNSIAQMLADGQINSLNDIVREMGKIYPSDEKFKADFSDKELRTTQARNKRIVRYLLFEIEKHVSGNDYDYESDKYNIEHVMPQSLNDEWDHITDRDHEQSLYNLGNMTILKTSENRDIENAGFNSKKAVFQNSELVITRRIAEENSEWNSERIRTHQKWLASQATAIWRISQLS